ncbi:MAG: selenide, water dikinase SelD [Candidatus Helarchaeota archaeon]
MDKLELDKLLETSNIKIRSPKIIMGIGDDAAVIKINDELVAIKSIDVFTPIIDDPILQGKITACNVTNDIYAMGATNIIGVLVFLAIDLEMPLEVSSGILKGFQEFCINNGTTIVGGQTIQNPWPLIGGEATAIWPIDKVIYSSNVKIDDYLVLTKPLGIQPIMAAYRIVRDEENEFADNIYELLPKKDYEKIEEVVIKSMTTSNRPVAEVFQEVEVNAATDITGFGLCGHAETMVVKNKNVDIEIQNMPIFKGALEISDFCSYGLEVGRASETAGGMLISVSPDNLDLLLHELKNRRIYPHIVGRVKHGSGKVYLAKDVKFTECEVV